MGENGVFLMGWGRSLGVSSTLLAAISSEEQYLMDYVCPEMPEEGGCIVGVLTWWSKIASIIFSEHSTRIICNGLNSECQTRYSIHSVNFCILENIARNLQVPTRHVFDLPSLTEDFRKIDQGGL